MLKSFITSTDLTSYEPNLTSWIPSTWTTAPTVQIGKAVDEVIQDLRTKGTNAGKVAIPLHLKENGTFTANETSLGVECLRVNMVQRFVISKTSSAVGSVTEKIYLDGSNDNINWSEITSITITAGSGDLSATFSSLYLYYRYRVVINTSLTLSASIYMVETSFDKLLIFKSLEILFRALSKAVGDMFDNKSKIYQNDYDMLLKEFKYAYDEDDSQSIEIDEEMNEQYRILL